MGCSRFPYLAIYSTSSWQVKRIYRARTFKKGESLGEHPKPAIDDRMKPAEAVINELGRRVRRFIGKLQPSSPAEQAAVPWCAIQ